jgi:HEAT repeat protein
VRGRRAALASALLAAALVVAAGILGRRPLLERWHLSRLDSTDREVRLDAARRLAAMESARAVEQLLAPIRRADSGDHVARAEALAEMGELAVPALVAAYEEGDLFVRLIVLRILRQMGPWARGAIPLLVEVEHSYLVSAAVDALAGMGESGVRPLLEMLASEKSQVRVLAARALGRTRPQLVAELHDFAGRSASFDALERRERYRTLRHAVLGGGSPEEAEEAQ